MTRPLIEYHAEPIRVPGKPLGRLRLVNEVEAKQTLVMSEPTDVQVASLSSVFWSPNMPRAFDQLRGSCTGNAVAGCASTQPFGWQLTQDDAENLYSRATQLDPFVGAWPPDDTGSTGWAAMTAAVERGLFTGFSLAQTLYAVLLALQSRPGIQGQDWYQGDDEPDADGLVAPTGLVRGGHETMLAGCEIARRDDGTIDLLGSCIVERNSWNGWGLSINGATGYFKTRLPHFAAKMASGADCHFPDLP